MDIGANIGFYSRQLGKLTGPTGQIHCFEPDDTNFNFLVRTTKRLPNVFLNKKAVSDSNTPIKIYTSPVLNVDHRTYPIEQYESVYPVEVISIDEYVAGRFKVDFIKMDIQGAELAALKGMRKTLTANPNVIVLMELWPFGLKACNTALEELLDYVHALGFTVYIIKNGSISKFSIDKLKEYAAYGKDDYDNVVLSRNPI